MATDEQSRPSGKPQGSRKSSQPRQTRHRGPSSGRRRDALPVETFQADAVTVGWLVCGSFTGLMNVASVVLAIIDSLGYHDGRIVVLLRLTIAASLLAGIGTLTLSYLVQRIRVTPPPPSMMATMVVNAIIPLVFILVRVLFP